MSEAEDRIKAIAAERWKYDIDDEDTTIIYTPMASINSDIDDVTMRAIAEVPAMLQIIMGDGSEEANDILRRIKGDT